MLTLYCGRRYPAQRVSAPKPLYEVSSRTSAARRQVSEDRGITHSELRGRGSRVYVLTSSVVLMDELDQLLTAKQDVVYNFFNWPTMRDSQLFVIAVANRMDLPQHLAAKIKSRLG